MKKNVEVPQELRDKLSEYLLKLKEQRQLGFNQLSLKADINVKSLNLIMNGKTKRINPYQLQKLASALRIDYKELYKIVGYLDKDATLDLGNIETQENYKQIPLYSSISAGCGLEDQKNEDIEFISVPDISQFSGDVVAIRVNGDSMEYTIEDRSIVFVRKGMEVPNKKVGAFILNNKALLKRYVCKDGNCVLRSDNREYVDLPISNKDSFEIIGKVIGQMESVD